MQYQLKLDVVLSPVPQMGYIHIFESCARPLYVALEMNTKDCVKHYARI